ncbi:protein CDV3 homolog [Ylistrum balloti]|uniref:protein CDV3 homolog n=1 Tax=Ylistrum balloti TaxID=509963 RepID=UPI0029059AFC|nr:protein CDV3 homolog [Ylistrum balloti]
MADTSLDDFFAKKDKSKKKNKSKTTPSDILSKHDNFVSGDDTTKVKKKKKEKDKQNAATSNTDSTNTGNATQVKEDEEWVDFVDESEKDYTGLRIQNLQISQKEGAEEVEEEDKDNENDEDGESGERRDTSGPWNVSQSSRARVEVVQEAPPAPAEEPPKEEAPKAPTKYVPPGARGSQASGESLGSRAAVPRRKKGAPNIKSEDDFPTLGGGAPEVASWGPTGVGNFERVQGGGKQVEDPSKVNMQLSLGNKYAALQD